MTTNQPDPKPRKFANVHWIDLPTGRTIRTSMSRIYSHCVVMNLHSDDDGSLRQEVLGWSGSYQLATKAEAQWSRSYVAGRSIGRFLMPDGAKPNYSSDPEGYVAAKEQTFTVAAVFVSPCQVVLSKANYSKAFRQDLTTADQAGVQR